MIVLPSQITASLNGIREALSQATLYHYGGIALVIIASLLLMILGLMLRRSLGLALSLVFLSFIGLTVGPFGVYAFVDQSVRKVTFSQLSSQQLIYIDDIVVTGVLKNEGKVDFSSCTIRVELTPPPPFPWLSELYRYKVLQSQTTLIQKPLPIGTQRDFRAVVPGLAHQPCKIYLSGVCR